MKNKVNIPLFLAGILFCLTLISISITSNLIAKYSTTVSEGDSARVAGFHPVATITPVNSTILYDTNTSDYEIKYTVGVSNASEVAVKYDVVISFEENNNKLSGAKLKLDNNDEVTISQDSIRYDNVGVLPANDKTGKTHTLTFTVTKGLIEQLIAGAPGSELDLTSSFTVTVDFTQLD